MGGTPSAKNPPSWLFHSERTFRTKNLKSAFFYVGAGTMRNARKKRNTKEHGAAFGQHKRPTVREETVGLVYTLGCLVKNYYGSSYKLLCMRGRIFGKRLLQSMGHTWPTYNGHLYQLPLQPPMFRP